MALRFLNSGYFAGKVGIGTQSPDFLLDISSATSTDFIKLKSEGSSASPIKFIFEKSSGEQGVIEYNRNGDLEIYNTDGDGGVMIDGSASAGGDFYVAHSGNIGIGTTTPNAKLDIQGTQGQLFSVTDDLSGEIFAVSDISGVPIMTVNSSGVSYFDGKVGIGTESPSQKLHIDSGKMLITHNTTEQYNYQYDSNQPVWSFGGGNYFNVKKGGSTVFTISSSTNVGIGTTSPPKKLTVNGQTQFYEYSGAHLTNQATSNFNFNTLANNSASSSGGSVGAFIKLTATPPGNTGTWSAFRSRAYGENAQGNTDEMINFFAELRNYTSTNAVTLDHHAGLKINSLGVGGLATVTNNYGVYLNPGTAATHNYGVYQSGTDVKNFFQGKVGIGTTAPSYPLTVRSETGNVGTAFFDSVDNWERIYIGSTNEYIERKGSEQRMTFAAQGSDGYFTYQTSGSEKLRIDNNGNVGIGTTAPSQKLHISGNMRLTGAFRDRLNSQGAANYVLTSTGSNGTQWVDASSSSIIGGPYLPLAGGTMTGTAGVLMPDDFNLKIGTGSDLKIFHNATDSFIINETGNLKITQGADDGDIIFESDNGSGGTTQYFRVDGGADRTIFSRSTRHSDGVVASFGTSEDFQIYHDGSNSFINEVGTGDLYLQTNGTNMFLRDSASGNTFISMNVGTADVSLKQGGNTKLTTTSTGITVTGAATATTFLGDLNGTINTATTAVTKANATNDTTVATTAFVQNLIGTIPAGLVFQGTWNAATNTPTLTSGSGTTGHFYIVSTDGSTNLDGITDWKVGDWAVFVEQGASDQWEKVDNSSVLDGSGTGQTVSMWSGSGTSNTLTDAPITISSGNTTITGKLGIGALNTSFDLYNNGSTYLNGALTVDAAFTQSGGAASTFSGTVLIDGVSNYTGLEVKGTGASRPSVNLSNATTGILGQVYATESSALVFATTVSGTTALTLDASQNATFAGNVTISNASPALNLTDTDNSSNIALSSVGGALVVNSPSDQVHQIGGTEKFRIASNKVTALVDELELSNDFSIQSTDGNYWQRIKTVDSTAASTEVFSFDVRKGAGTNWTQLLVLKQDDSATFAGSIDTTAVNIKVGSAIHGTITSSSNSLTLNARNTGIMLFQSGSVEKMRIANNGNVGIGEIDPDGKLHIHQTGSGTLNTIITEDDARKLFIGRDAINCKDLSNNNAILYLNQSGGNVSVPNSSLGIGTTTPDFGLEVDGTFGVSGLPGNGSSTSVLVQNQTTTSLTVVNGDFATDSDWTKGTGWTISGGKANVDGTQTGTTYLYQGGILPNPPEDIEYIITYTISNYSAGEFRINVGGYISSTPAQVANGTYEVKVTPTHTSSNTNIYVQANPNAIGSVDNVSVKQVTAGTNQIQTRELGTGAFGPTPVGAYLPLAGGTMTGTTRHGDNVTSYWGDGDDLEIYHNSSGDSVIQNHVGDLYFTNKADNKDIVFRSDDGAGGFETYFYLDGSSTGTNNPMTVFPDNSKLGFGNAAVPDLLIYHDSNNSYIVDNGTGDLAVITTRFYVKSTAGEAMFRATENGACDLFHNNIATLSTTSTGIDVSGEIKIDSALLSNQENLDIDSAAAETIAQVSTASYTAAFFDFVVNNSALTSVRSGTVYACTDGTNVEFTETSTQDIGDTSDVVLSVDISGGQMRLRATVASDNWSVKSLIRAI